MWYVGQLRPMQFHTTAIRHHSLQCNAIKSTTISIQCSSISSCFVVGYWPVNVILDTIQHWPITDCTTNVIGQNTGVYLGGLPNDFVIHRQEVEGRFQVGKISLGSCAFSSYTSSLGSLHVGLVYGKTSITVKQNTVIRQWNEQCRSSCKTECSVYSNNSNYAVVTCEIKLCWNNFEIISVFCFTCNHDFIRLKLLKLMTGAVQSLTRQGDN